MEYISITSPEKMGPIGAVLIDQWDRNRIFQERNCHPNGLGRMGDPRFRCAQNGFQVRFQSR